MLKANHAKAVVFMQIKLLKGELEAITNLKQVGDFKVNIKQPYRQTVVQGVLQGGHPSISVDYIKEALQEKNISFEKVSRMHGYESGQKKTIKSSMKIDFIGALPEKVILDFEVYTIRPAKTGGKRRFNYDITLTTTENLRGETHYNSRSSVR